MIDSRYSRNEALFGAEGQRLIAATKATIIGLGGLGCHVAQLLGYLGVIDYHLVDKDIVSESSMNRLIGAVPADVDTLAKVQGAERLIRTIHPDASVKPIQDWLESERGGVAIAVFGCLDRDLHRVALIERCVASGVPFFDLATDTDNRAGLVYGGRVLFSGDRDRCPFCMDLLDQDELREDTMTAATGEAHDRIYGVDRDALDGTGPSVVSINGVVASLAVTEFMVWRTGLRAPNGLLTYRADQGGVRVSRDTPRDGCPFCS
jgi:molybdopterin-synthase adenylyltransferase